jgi:DNA invertase Pin-like site-specific DNA recombinase
MLIGYARVSTQDQTLDLQTDALKQAGCEKLFTDSISGTKSERPGLQEAMNHLRVGGYVSRLALGPAWPHPQTPHRYHHRSQ